MKLKRIVGLAFFSICLVAVLVICVIYVPNTAIATCVGTIIGTIFSVTVTSLINTCFMPCELDGYYKTEITTIDDPTSVIKQDKCRFKERKIHEFDGSGSRCSPSSRRPIKWKCYGYFVAGQLMIVYRAKNTNVQSRGVAILKEDSPRTKDSSPRYVGRYDKFVGEKVVQYRITLIKISKKEYKELG